MRARNLSLRGSHAAPGPRRRPQNDPSPRAVRCAACRGRTFRAPGRPAQAQPRRPRQRSASADRWAIPGRPSRRWVRHGLAQHRGSNARKSPATRRRSSASTYRPPLGSSSRSAPSSPRLEHYRRPRGHRTAKVQPSEANNSASIVGQVEWRLAEISERQWKPLRRVEGRVWRMPRRSAQGSTPANCAGSVRRVARCRSLNEAQQARRAAAAPLGVISATRAAVAAGIAGTAGAAGLMGAIRRYRRSRQRHRGERRQRDSAGSAVASASVASTWRFGRARAQHQRGRALGRSRIDLRGRVEPRRRTGA